MISDDDVEEAPGDGGPEPTPSPSTAPPASAPPAHRGAPWWVLALLVAALVAAVVVAVLQADAAADAEADAAVLEDQRDARLVAAQFAEAFFTFDSADLDATTETLLGLVTERYATDFQSNRLPGLDELFANTQLNTTATAQSVFLDELDDGGARAVVVVDVNAASEVGEQGLQDLSLLLELRQQGDEWRVDEVSIAPSPQQVGADGQPVAPGEGSTTTTFAPSG